MSDQAKDIRAKQAVGGTDTKAGIPVWPLMLSVLLSVAVAVAGVVAVVFWLARSGRLPLGGIPKAQSAVQSVPVKTHLVALEPLLVNLSDEGGHSYLRVALTLRVQDPPSVKGAPKEEVAKGKPVNEFEAAERDVALGVMGRENGIALLAADGKERLKEELRVALAERLPEVKVADILFTEFLVQR